MLTSRLIVLAFLAVFATAPSIISAGQGARPAGALTPVKVYKTPTCGCCAKWVEHIEAAGFKADVQDLPDLTVVKNQAGVPAQMQSCHTALVDGYVVEGHVPADIVRQLLRDRPKVTGIAVPGMPIGSPGMEQGSRKDPYDVLTFTKEGRTSVFASR